MSRASLHETNAMGRVLAVVEQDGVPAALRELASILEADGPVIWLAHNTSEKLSVAERRKAPYQLDAVGYLLIRVGRWLGWGYTAEAFQRGGKR
jgi:hypothetical protein